MSDSWGITWNVTPDVAWGNMAQRHANAIERDIVRLCESLLDPIQEWMRSEARWNDVTGQARQALYTDLIHVAREGVKILLSHGPAIEYAVWLEIANAGRYSILPDAVDFWAPKIFRGVREIVQRRGTP